MTQEEQSILEEKGREANRDLNFRQWNKSKLAQYFTPMRAANLLYAMVKELFSNTQDPAIYIKRLNVLDPTAGSGRLLYPFKREEANVLGVELDKELIEKAKMLLGKEAVRHGSIMEYATYLEDAGFDICVTNPPYGLLWSQDESEFQFAGLSQARNIESQNAVLQIIAKALQGRGLMFAIIPTSTFQNEKDEALRQSFYNNFDLLLRATVDGMFKEEYGIDVQVDIIAAQMKPPYRPSYEQPPEPRIFAVDWRKETAEQAILHEWKKITGEIWLGQNIKGRLGKTIPHLESLIEPDFGSIQNEITIKGFKGTPWDNALLDFHQETVNLYSPVVGKPVGVKASYLDQPALLTRGVGPAINLLSNYGYSVMVTPQAQEKIDDLAEKFKILSIPIYRPKDHQRLAYFEEREYEAKADVYDMADESDYRQDHRGNGEAKQPSLLFKAGKKYYLRPSWIRQSEKVGVEVIQEGKKEKVITTSIDRGFLSIEVNTEQGKRSFREPEPVEVATLLEGFELPDVPDVAEVMPEKVQTWKKKLLKAYPHIFTEEFDYQAEDLARILSKTKSAYLGYDLGGGKTICAFAFMAIRGIKRVLIICQSSLIENWLNEARKFGFQAQRLTTHKGIDALQKEMRERRKPERTQFYITSYEFLSLDTGRFFDPWECLKYDKDGNIIHNVQGNRGRTCAGCSTEFPTISLKCPKCKAKEEWTGKYCLACHYSAYTYSSKDSIIQYPAYRRIRKLFGGVICDELQMSKSKTSFRGQAMRAIKAPSRLGLTGTLMKGYITDTFYNIGYLTRHNNPIFPYRFDVRGSKLFAEEFATFEYKDIVFDETLHKGRKKQLPEVSNLNRFWKILASFTVRRLKDEMVRLPPMNRRIMALPMDGPHVAEYENAVATAKEIIDREMRKDQSQINMGMISRAIWGMRFAATIPRIAFDRNIKIRKAVELTKAARDRGEKVLVYSALREMQAALHEQFTKEGIEHIFIPSTVQTKDRFSRIKEFQENGKITAIVAGLNVLNRGFTITAANNVIFTDIEFSPESTEQATGRAHRTGQEKEVTCYYLLIDWEEEKENIDFRMFNLITQKQKAISNAIDGKVRFAGTAKVLSAGGDYLAIAKMIQGDVKDPLEFEYEKFGAEEGVSPSQATAPKIVTVTVDESGLWDKMRKELKEKHKEARRKPQTEGQLTLF